MPCVYTPLDCASAHVAIDVFVTRFGSESGSTIATIRSGAYFGSAMIDAIGSMYSLLYRAKPFSAAFSSPLGASAAQSRLGRSYTTIWIVTGVPPPAWASAASRCPRRPRESVVPAIAAIRSSQTAVEVFATLAIWAPSVPPLAAAAADTRPDQSGFTYPFAPAYGLSTCVPGCVGVVVVVGVVGMVGVKEVVGVVVRVMGVVGVVVGVPGVPSQWTPL